MSAFQRTLTFQSNNLGKAVAVLLTFTPLDDNQLWHDLKPVAWQVLTFPASGPQRSSVVYQSQLAFIVPQIVNGNVVAASTWTPINLGQETKITKVSGGYNFSNPSSSSSPDVLIATNNAGEKIDIGVGFLNNNLPATTLVFQSVGNTNSVKCKYTPTLAAYITSDFQQNDVLKGDIETRNPVWKENLALLSPSTTYNITIDGAGEYHITPTS